MNGPIVHKLYGRRNVSYKIPEDEVFPQTYYVCFFVCWRKEFKVH